MITTAGKRHIKRYLMHAVPTIGRSIALGIGSTTPTPEDRALEFEIARAPVTLVTYDFTNERLIFKATVPDTFQGIIREVGIWSLETNSAAGDYGSQILTSFDSGLGEWSAGTWTADEARVGGDSLTLSPAANSTASAELMNAKFDLSGNSAEDTFLLALNVEGGTNSITIRFHTDSSNYYEWTFVPVAGYQFASGTKGELAAVGSPDWEEVNTITVMAGAGATAGVVNFDALRIEDVDTLNPDYVLVAREPLINPYVRRVGAPTDVEISIEVNL